jgi:hypothetical protein
MNTRAQRAEKVETPAPTTPQETVTITFKVSKRTHQFVRDRYKKLRLKNAKVYFLQLLNEDGFDVKPEDM